MPSVEWAFVCAGAAGEIAEARRDQSVPLPQQSFIECRVRRRVSGDMSVGRRGKIGVRER